MIRNVLVPFLLIVLTSAVTVYCWYEGLPLSLFGLIGFPTLFLGNMYISYFVFYHIFPDKRNKPLPPVNDLVAQAKRDKDKPAVHTKGAIWGTIFTVVLTAGGIYSWSELANKYADYQLTQYGRNTKAVIISSGHTKGIGDYREYEYMDDAGKKHTDKVSNQSLWLGDTIQIIYSTDRPVINRIISPLP